VGVKNNNFVILNKSILIYVYYDWGDFFIKKVTNYLISKQQTI
jgi:hypothetical protein